MKTIEHTIKHPSALDRTRDCAQAHTIYVIFPRFIIFKRHHVIILLRLRFLKSLIHVLIDLGVLGLYIHAYSLQKRQFMLFIDIYE